MRAFFLVCAIFIRLRSNQPWAYWACQATTLRHIRATVHRKDATLCTSHRCTTPKVSRLATRLANIGFLQFFEGSYKSRSQSHPFLANRPLTYLRSCVLYRPKSNCTKCAYVGEYVHSVRIRQPQKRTFCTKELESCLKLKKKPPLTPCLRSSFATGGAQWD